MEISLEQPRPPVSHQRTVGGAGRTAVAENGDRTSSSTGQRDFDDTRPIVASDAAGELQPVASAGVECDCQDVYAVAFSPDGRTLAAGGGVSSTRPGNPIVGSIKLWNAETGQLLHEFALPVPVFSLAFSPDGRTFAAGTSLTAVVDPMPKAAPIYLFDASTGKKLKELTPKNDDVHALAFSQDGNTLFSASDKAIRSWDVRNGTEGRRIDIYTRAAVFSQDLKIAVTEKGKRGEDIKGLVSWDLATGKELRVFPDVHGPTGFNSLTLSPDGRLLASGCQTKTVQVTELATGKVLFKLPADDREVWSLGFSPDSKRLVTGLDNGTSLVWDVTPAGRVQQKPPPPPIVESSVWNVRKGKTRGTEFVEIGVGSDDGLRQGDKLCVFRETSVAGEPVVKPADVEEALAASKELGARLERNDQGQVTNAGLEHLEGPTKLKSLSLQETAVTKDGLSKLEKALPRCRITFP